MNIKWICPILVQVSFKPTSKKLKNVSVTHARAMWNKSNINNFNIPKKTYMTGNISWKHKLPI